MDNFYSQTPVLKEFTAIADLSNYTELPIDWHIVVADIHNSTGAIENGHYKAVNIIGVSVITAVLNITKSLSLPYIFGGDGAILCIPQKLYSKTSKVLCATKTLAKEKYNLDLRVGIVPVTDIIKAGFKALVARHRVSKHYIQAAFAGGGIEYAENLIKNNIDGAAYRLNNIDGSHKADFSGLECRWENVPSQHGETISLIVKATAPTIAAEIKIIREVITKISQIYGDDDACRPICMAALRLTFDNQNLCHEARIRTFGQNKIAFLNYWISLLVQNFLGWFYMKFKMVINDVNWGHYKTEFVNNTDFKKFDDILREVLAGTSKQRNELEIYLAERQNKNHLIYGIHVSDSALLTCMINKYSGDHFHFVDGAKGGYAKAAAKMKSRTKQLALQSAV